MGNSKLGQAANILSDGVSEIMGSKAIDTDKVVSNIKDKTLVNKIKGTTPKPLLEKNIDYRATSLYRDMTSGEGANINKSIFTIKDYTWYGGEKLTDEEYANVPKIILAEFQPKPNIGWQGLVKDATSAVDHVSTVVISSIYKLMGRNTGGYSGVEKRAAHVLDYTQAGTSYFEKMQTGEYLNMYEMPFFGDTYISAKGTSGWADDGGGGTLMDKAKDMVRKIESIFEKQPLPVAPKWTSPDLSGNEYEFSFKLINASTADLIKNFKFIHSFMAGQWWIQSGYQQVSPNLYDVEVPGRFRSFFSAVATTVTYEGKLRRYADASATLSLCETILYPEVYNITINVVDLTPSNFNTYVDYYNKHHGTMDATTLHNYGDETRLQGMGEIYAKEFFKNNASTIIDKTLEGIGLLNKTAYEYREEINTVVDGSMTAYNKSAEAIDYVKAKFKD